MSLVDLNPAGLNLASLKPTTAASIAQDEAGQVQQQLAQVQLTNAQDEQQRNNAFRTAQAVAAKAPSVEAYTRLLATAPREYVEGLKASISQMDSTARKTLAAQVLEPWLSGANGRPDLQKIKLEAQRDGFAARGMTDKAAGVQDLIDKMKTDPDGVTAKLYATYVEAVGPERAKAVLDSLGMTEERLKKKADRILAEANADPTKTGAALREQVAKARDAELGADIKEIEKPLTKPKILATIESQKASATRDLAAGEHSTYLTEKGRLTMGDEVAKAAAENRTAQAGATVAEAGATKEAIEAKKEQERQQTAMFKANAAKAEADAKALPAHVGDAVLSGTRAARESQAAAVRARTVADGYRRIATSASTGIPAKLEAWAREVAGTQNRRDALNQLADRVTNEEIINQAQKIRPVSDTDMVILRRGIPDPRGNSKRVADFMDALARAHEKQASVTIDETAWQAAFRGPNNADRSAVVNGVRTKNGESILEFVQRAGEVREAIAIARDPKTDSARAARIRAKLKADGEVL